MMFYYVTHIDNVRSILEKGIFSRENINRTYACCSFVAQTSQFVAGDRCVFQKFSSNRTGCSQNCVSPD